MNEPKKAGPGWVGIITAIVLISLLISPASMMIALGAMSGQAQRIVENSEGDPVVFMGIGNSGNNWGVDGRSRLARTLAGLERDTEITDEMLRQVFDAIERRAVDGDVEAAAVIARIAQIEREP